MSSDNIQKLTEEYPWDIKVPPRSQMEISSSSLGQGCMAFNFGFMGDIHHSWGFKVYKNKIQVDIDLQEDLTGHLVHLIGVYIELISRSEIKFRAQPEIRIVSEFQLPKSIMNRYYLAVWLPTACWDDSIDKIRIIFEISREISNIEPKITNHIQAKKPIQDIFKGFLFSDYLSDTTVVCGGKEFKAHRLILAGQSQVFEAMFRADMAEAQSGRIEITDFEPEVLEQLLKYMYTEENPAKSEVSKMIVQMYCIAHKYLVTGLKDFCEPMLLENVNLDNAFEMCELARLYSVESLKLHAFDIIKLNKKQLCENGAKLKEIVNKFPDIACEVFNSFG